jgi:hypothetical protein
MMAFQVENINKNIQIIFSKESKRNSRAEKYNNWNKESTKGAE